MPKNANIHIDTFLTGVLSGYKNAAYGATMAVPVKTTAKLSGKIGSLDRSHYRLDFDSRAMGSHAQSIDFDYGSVTYNAEEHCLEFPLDDRQRANYDDPLDGERDATLVLAEKLNLRMEYNIATLLGTTGNYYSGHTSATLKNWDSTGTPVTDVQTAIETIVAATGASLDNMYGVCSYKTFMYLRLHSDITGNYTSTNPGAANKINLGPQQVADALGLAGLFVSSAVYNTAAEGATESMSYVFGDDDFCVFAKAPVDGLLQPAFASVVAPAVAGFPNGAAAVVDKYRDESRKSDIIRATILSDEIVVNSRYGYLYTNVW